MKRFGAAILVVLFCCVLAGCSPEDAALVECDKRANDADRAACRSAVYRAAQVRLEKPAE